ncbi:putative rhamnogalacturonase A [Diplonema papillatum]|nr:putative rhamnogalacturonase A [Diplonema papillatum]
MRSQVFFAVAAAAAAVDAAPDCDILSHGAVCDGTTDDTNAIQAAIDACVGGGHVVFAADKKCMTYPLKLAGNNSLYFPAGSVLRAAGMDNWPSGKYYNLFSVTHTSNISVFGTGTIDGNGQAWWSTVAGTRPRMFHMQYVSDISIKGVTLINSPMMTIVLNNPCERAYIEDVTIWNYAVGSTDGIDFGCNGGLIRNVSVTNGDDSICMKSGAKNLLIVNSSTQQVPAYPAALEPGRGDGLVLGTSGNNSMHNVTSRDCTATGTLRGITFKFRPTRNGRLADICMKSGAKNLLIVNSSTQQGPAYPAALEPGRGDGLVLGTSGNNSMHNVTFRDCTATGTLRGITFKFRPTQNGTVSDIMFENIRIVDPQAYAINFDINSAHAASSADEGEASLGTVHVNNVVIRNVTGRATTVGLFTCNDPPYTCTNITLEDVHITNYTDPACTWKNAYGSGSNVEPASCMPPASNDTSA